MEKAKGTAVNFDCDVLYHIYKSCGGDMTDFEGTLRSYIRGYAGKGVSDLMMNCFGQSSICPTEVFTWAAEKYQQKQEHGVAVDYTENIWLRSIAESYKALEQDPFEIMLEEAKSCGIRSWISVRMNDAHCLAQETWFGRGDIFYEAVEKGMVIGDEVAGSYYGKCLDFGWEYIREKKFAYLCEMIDRYDMDGLELDFQREIFCFDYVNNPDCCEIMTEFMKRVRTYLRSMEQKRGHKILLCVRVVPDIAHNKAFGFDTEEWVSLGLVDVLVPTSRWECSDSTMQISDWKELVKGTPVEIYAGMEVLLRFPVFQTLETVKGFAAQYLDAGADKIYLYNFFRLRAKDMQEQDFKAYEDYEYYLKNVERDDFLRDVWEACSAEENCKRGVRRHVMTFREDCMIPRTEKNRQHYRPLPARITGEQVFYLETGDCQERKVTLYLGVRRQDAEPSVRVDKAAALSLGITDEAYVCHPVLAAQGRTGYEEMAVYAYEATVSAGNTREIAVSGSDLVLQYLEIKVE